MPSREQTLLEESQYKQISYACNVPNLRAGSKRTGAGGPREWETTIKRETYGDYSEYDSKRVHI